MSALPVIESGYDDDTPEDELSPEELASIGAKIPKADKDKLESKLSDDERVSDFVRRAVDRLMREEFNFGLSEFDYQWGGDRKSKPDSIDG